jgi:putative transposase
LSTQILVDMLKDDRVIKRYSESFKLKVLHELSQGKFTKNEIYRVYDISPSSLDTWIRKYGRLDLFNKRIKIETMDDIEKLKKIEEENKKLRDLLVQKEIDGLMNEAYLEYAAKQLGYKSVDEFKKKVKK